MFRFLPQEENLLDVLQLVLSIMTEQPETCIPVFDKVDGLRYSVVQSVCLPAGNVDIVCVRL